MRIETAVRQVTNNTGATAQTYQFELNAKTAQLLADPYSNKPRAVLREYGCNAADAHQMAGKPDMPFEVWLPSRIDPVLIIKDYGTGLAPADIANLFCKYGGSDKDKRNDVTGGLGFGSKAAWAVTDQFSVEARWNGKMHCFTMYKDEEGMPVFTEVGVIDTIEPNGLTIKIPIKAELINSFHDEARKVFRRFNPLPKIVNVPDFKLPVINYALKQHGWRIPRDTYDRETSEYRSAMAVQGNVAYPIETRSLGDLTEQQEAVLEMATEIDFPMGDISVPLSREAISYNKKTVAAILKRLQEIGDSLPTLYQSEIDACETIYEASAVMARITKPMGYKVKNLVTKHLRWRGASIPEYLTTEQILHLKVTQYVIDSHELSRRQRVNLAPNNDGKLHFHPGQEIVVWWDKQVKSIRPYIDEFWKQQCIRESKSLNILVCEDKAALDVFLKSMGNPPYLNVNDFTLPEKPKVQNLSTGPSRAPTAKVFVCERGGSFDETSLPGDHGGEYVAIYKGEVQGCPSYWGNYVRQVRAFRGHDSMRVYGIPGSHKHLPTRYPDKWVDFYDAVLDELRAFTKDKTKRPLISSLWFNLNALTDNDLIELIRFALTNDPSLTATQFGVRKKSDFNLLVESIRPFMADWDRWKAYYQLVGDHLSKNKDLRFETLKGTPDMAAMARSVFNTCPLVEQLFKFSRSTPSGDEAVELFKHVATYVAKM